MFSNEVPHLQFPSSSWYQGGHISSENSAAVTKMMNMSKEALAVIVLTTLLSSKMVECT